MTTNNKKTFGSWAASLTGRSAGLILGGMFAVFLVLNVMGGISAERHDRALWTEEPATVEGDLRQHGRGSSYAQATVVIDGGEHAGRRLEGTLVAIQAQPGDATTVWVNNDTGRLFRATTTNSTPVASAAGHAAGGVLVGLLAAAIAFVVLASAANRYDKRVSASAREGVWV